MKTNIEHIEMELSAGDIAAQESFDVVFNAALALGLV